MLRIHHELKFFLVTGVEIFIAQFSVGGSADGDSPFISSVFAQINVIFVAHDALLSEDG